MPACSNSGASESKSREVLITRRHHCAAYAMLNPATSPIQRMPRTLLSMTPGRQKPQSPTEGTYTYPTHQARGDAVSKNRPFPSLTITLPAYRRSNRLSTRAISSMRPALPLLLRQRRSRYDAASPAPRTARSRRRSCCRRAPRTARAAPRCAGRRPSRSERLGPGRRASWRGCRRCAAACRGALLDEAAGGEGASLGGRRAASRVNHSGPPRRAVPSKARPSLYVGPRPRSTAAAPRGCEQLSSERSGDSCSGGRSRYSASGELSNRHRGVAPAHGDARAVNCGHDAS
jgi:hypothetical protein